MRVFIVMMILASVLMNSIAQDEDVDTVYYVVSVGQTASDLVPFRSALASRGYNFKRFDNDMHDRAEVVGFLGDVTEDGRFNFRLLTENRLFVTALSSILYDRYDDPILRSTVAEFIDVLTEEDLASFLDFTLSYINNNCENVTGIAVQADFSELAPATRSFVNFAIGNCMLSLEDFDQAVGYLGKAVHILKNNEITQPYQIMASHINLTWAYIQLGDYEPARQTLHQLDELSTDYSDAVKVQVLQDRSQLLALMFDYTAAIDDMDAAIELVRSNYGLARVYKQRGDIIMLIYEWNRALDDYNKAIELDPDYAEAYYRRGILHYTMVERDNAIADFETYLGLEPEGEFVESAQQFIDDIQTELGALGG